MFDDDQYTQGLEIYLVGGAVRDKILGNTPRERDWVVVHAHEKTLIERGFIKVAKYFPVFLHPLTKEEYALARTEKSYGTNHQSFQFATDGVSLVDDLRRRDLTINAIAQDKNGNLIDPFKGQADINKRILRHVSAAFVEDPLRVFRVARFKGILQSFTISEETLCLMEHMVNTGMCHNISKERILEEINKCVLYGDVGLMWQVLERVGITSKILHVSKPITQYDVTKLNQIPKSYDLSLRISIVLILVDHKGSLVNYLPITRLSKKFYQRMVTFLSVKTFYLSASLVYFMLMTIDSHRRDRLFITECIKALTFISPHNRYVHLVKLNELHNIMTCHVPLFIKNLPSYKRGIALKMYRIKCIKLFLLRLNFK